MRAADQVKLYEEASRLFYAGSFRDAMELFERAGTGPNLGMAHSARLHVRMCEQRLARQELELSSSEDHYNFAVALINRRDLTKAEEHLKEALRLNSTTTNDHIHYALALCLALRGDIEGSARQLKCAIDQNPRNRNLARSDPDFQEAGRQPPLRALIHPEKSGN
ncbi:MAG: TPR end-of-group domain-containing protein [Bryobacteraceae bacterium]